MIDKFFQLITGPGWTPFGAGVLIFLLAGMTCTLFLNIVKYIVILFRGWPPTPIEDENEIE